MSGDEGFGLYVHWPFCVSKCPYCDFNSHVVAGVDQSAWRAALLLELDHYARPVAGRTLTSIFFGGGTPSLMAPDTAEAIIAAARGYWETGADLEITLEANPGTVDEGSFAAFRDAGVNRLSMGVQALNDRDLAFLGRKHSIADARRAWERAARIFPRVSFDLIYARPQQTVSAWRDELAAALRAVDDCGITHLSLYQLTMEPGTAMQAAHARGEFTLPDEDAAAALYESTQELCEAAGFPAYEISNHAKPGQPSRHNRTYWRGGDYVGVGPGAHGRLTQGGVTRATRQIKAPSLWLKAVGANGHGTQEVEPITPEARAEELVLMGLRLTEGLDKARFARLAGRPLEQVIAAPALKILLDEGHLVDSATTLLTTAKGRLALNAVVASLLA
ncbi:MAG: radical SAM family heme chaperone HemW [Rhodospirillaceae bacterium]|nr:radical SAM family heme chaperone HemW [Rhodospirillaceae bacterium]